MNKDQFHKNFHPTVIQFLALLTQANAVVANSPVLSEWEIVPTTGEASNEAVRFTWTDADGDYSCTLTEGGIAAGHWQGGSFFCEDHEGDEVQISLYKHVAITPPACDMDRDGQNKVPGRVAQPVDQSVIQRLRESLESLQPAPTTAPTAPTALTATTEQGTLDAHLNVVLSAVQTNGHAIKWFGPKRQTPEVCLAAVQQDGASIQFLTTEQRTPEVCLAAVRQNAWAIQQLTAEQRTPEVCLAAVQGDGMAIECLTPNERTPQVCLAAMQQRGWAIRHLTHEQRSPEVCLAAVKREGWSIQHLTPAQRTPELCLVAVQQKGDVIECLPAEQRTPEVCLAAVKSSASAIEFLSQEERAAALALAESPVYAYVQEGGSTGELYLHTFDAHEDALKGAQSCAEASYRTTPIIEVPRVLADTPGFHDAVSSLLDALDQLDYVKEDHAEGGDQQAGDIPSRGQR